MVLSVIGDIINGMFRIGTGADAARNATRLATCAPMPSTRMIIPLS